MSDQTIPGVTSLDIDFPVILLDVSARYKAGISALELYEITRGAWRIGAKKDKASHAMAVANHVIREVYVIDSWHRAGTTPYRVKPFEPFAIDGRWEFLGRLAESSLRNQWIHQSVEHLMNTRLRNDVAYIHCDD